MKIFYVFLLVYVHTCSAWDSDQLEVFDVVDEVKENFYDLLNISKVSVNQYVTSDDEENYFIIPINFRMPLARKYGQDLGLCLSNYIQTRTWIRIPQRSSEIWCLFTIF